MNKEETIQKIKELPMFRFRDIALKEPILGDDLNGLPTTRWKELPPKFQAITEDKLLIPLAFVSNRYRLIQMENLFKPILEPIPECTANLRYSDGFAILDIFPEGPEYAIDETENRVGISAYNSVDRSCALVIRFSIKQDGRIYTIPRKSSVFRKVHTGKALKHTEDYINLLDKVRDSWKEIMQEMTTTVVQAADFKSICEVFNIGEKDQKELELKVGDETFTIWSLVRGEYDRIVERDYKTDVHQRKRIDALVESIFLWKAMSRMG